MPKGNFTFFLIFAMLLSGGGRMKIIRLKSENVMRLVAVDVTPQGNLIVVGGKNDAGKSSVLNSIAMALGGKAMCPAEPLRSGETEGKISVDLGDVQVMRRFSRNRINTRALGESDDDYAKKPKVYDETRSTLVVTNKDGAQYPSPQAMLDKLLGKLTFDPLAFAREGETVEGQRHQAETLRRLVGLDVASLDERCKVAFVERAMLKKSHEIKAAQLLALPTHADAPSAEVSIESITQEVAKAEECRKLAEDAKREVEGAQHRIDIYGIEEKVVTLSIEQIEEQLRMKREKLSMIQDKRADAERELEAKKVTADAACAVVPDAAVLRDKLVATELANRKVQANRLHAGFVAEVESFKRSIEVKHEEILKIEEEKKALTASVKFPIDGLGLSDDGVTFMGLPFSQASSSQQLRTSVAIGMALNPLLKVLLVRNGNMLDDDSLQAVAEQAEQADCQVWCEYVTADPKGVQVFIEDGHVAAQG